MKTAKEYVDTSVGDSYWHPDSARMSKKCFINHLQYFGWLKYKEGMKAGYKEAIKIDKTEL